MQFKNSDNNFGIVSISLHWIMAILVIGMLALGLYMTGLAVSPQKLKLYGWHKEFGALVLALVTVRLLWRVINTTPSLAELPAWERLAARAAHWAFYFFLFAQPLSGWLMSSAAGIPVSFFGLFTLPSLIPANDDLRILFKTLHQWLAYGLIATICVHVAAALKHHFIDKDSILRRMLWPSS